VGTGSSWSTDCDDEASHPRRLSRAEQQRAEAEKREGLRRRYVKLRSRCGPDQSIASELDAMLIAHKVDMGKQGSSRSSSGQFGGCSPSSTRAVTCAELARAVNESAGRSHMVGDIDFDTFVGMTSCDSKLDPALMDLALGLRSMFAKDDMSKLVAKHAHVSKKDLLTRLGTSAGMSWLKVSVEPLSFVAIILNGVLLGVSADTHRDWDGWETVEMCFVSFFLVELMLKIYFDGLRSYFTGPGCEWNIADFVFVAMSLVDFMLSLAVSGSEESNLQLFTIMRLVRLLRITRLVRLLRFNMFKELVLMIRGIMAASRCLFWAIMLLVFVIYCLGMVLRETMGQWCDPDRRGRADSFCTNEHLAEHGPQLFSSVSRSCFTMFRCLTEGCESSDGTPLMVHVLEDGPHGFVIVLLYNVCFLIVTFGLFNLVMAVFVETTLEAAKCDEGRRQQARHRLHLDVARKLHALLIHFSKVGTPRSTGSSWNSDPPLLDHQDGSSSVWRRLKSLFFYSQDTDDDDLFLVSTAEVRITRDIFKRVVSEPIVERLLENLDVQCSNPASLFDTLDADCSGTLDAEELIHGIMKVRGSVEKSDLVASQLAVRSVQRSLREFEARTVAGHLRLERLLTKISSLASSGQAVPEKQQQHIRPRPALLLWASSATAANAADVADPPVKSKDEDVDGAMNLPACCGQPAELPPSLEEALPRYMSL